MAIGPDNLFFTGNKKGKIQIWDIEIKKRFISFPFLPTKPSNSITDLCFDKKNEILTVHSGENKGKFKINESYLKYLNKIETITENLYKTLLSSKKSNHPTIYTTLKKLGIAPSTSQKHNN